MGTGRYRSVTGTYRRSGEPVRGRLEDSSLPLPWASSPRSQRSSRSLRTVSAYVNHRTIRLPTTIGGILIALVASLALIALHTVGPDLDEAARDLLASIDLDVALLQGMLSFLLFAGALHVDLAEQKRTIALLAIPLALLGRSTRVFAPLATLHPFGRRQEPDV